mgnify:CR=1 FL=1
MYSRKIRLLSLNMILVMLLTLIPAQARGEAEIDKNEKKIYTITLDGKDGTLGNENRITVNYSEDNPLSLGNYKFTRAGYTLVGWTKDENNDEWVADRNGIITVDLGYETLYAMWKADDYLEDNVSLVIGGEDKSDLLNSTTECSGTGWTYRSVDDTTSELHLSDGYNGGNIVCKRDNVNIVFDASVSTSQIEVSGALSLTANSTSAAVVSEDSCAIRAKSVAIANTGGIYRIVSNTKTAIEAESLYLASGNVSIEGNPAVSNSLPVTCEEGIAYRSNQNADGLMSGLYSYRENMTVTLKGNGGTLDGMTEEKIVVYSEEEPLNLRNYPFTRDGYVLVGWVSDLNSMKYEAGADETLAKTGSYDTLYAVWLRVPEDGNYIIIQGSQYNGASDSAKTSAGTFSSFDLPEDGKFTLPDLASVSTKNGAAVWADRFTEEAYLSGETATLKPGAFLSGWWHSSDGTYVIFDGNGGTMTNTVNGVQHIVTRHLVGLRIGGTYYRETRIAKPGYMVISYNTKADGSGEFYPVSSFTVPESMKEATVLYAQWALLDQLKDGVRLIIDSDDMTGLFGKNDWNYGTGWRFRDIGGSASSTYGQIDITNSTRYSGGRIAFDGNLTLGFVDGVSIGQIEAAGSLTLVNNASVGAQFSVKTNGVAAIRAESVTIKNSAAVYRISAENAVAVDASSLYLSSPNVIIEGRQAVAKYTKITCASGIGYKMSSDGSTLMTYSDTKRIALEGNGGTLQGLPMTIAEYRAVEELDLNRYPFTQEGYALVGWAADQKGEKLVTDATGHLKSTDYGTLYAVWLKVPDGNYVILQGSYAGACATKAGFSSIAMAEDGTVTLPEPVHQNGIAIWKRRDTNEPYLAGEKASVPTGTRFGCSLYYNSNMILIFDGNEGTTTSTVNGVQCTVSRQMVNAAVGGTYRSRSQFVKAGYTMTGYNTKADGTGKSYPYDEILVTEDMDDQTILYAQWEKITPSGKYITIDGKIYDAMQECRGNGWNYNYHADSDEGRLWLMDYHGGSIVSDLSLAVFAFGTNNTVSGSIESKETLQVSVAGQRMNNELTPGNLRVRASEGYALRAGRTMRLEAADGELNISGGENGPALYTQELQISCWENGFFEATGSPNALSYGKMIKDRYQTYLIRGGKDKESAVPITDDTYDNRAYISYEMRDRVLMLHGVDGVTETGENLYVVRSKSNSIDLGAYSNVFTNAGRRLLGWSRTENPATIDYAAASSTAYCFEYNYEFGADLYAVWESDGQIGVVLKDYGCYEENGGYTYSKICTVPVSGGTFELPKSYKSGYVFTGWLGSDGQTYTAGTQIEVSASAEFTAQYATGTFEIDGKTYSTDRPHGSQSLGWAYDPHTEWNWGQAEIDIYSNYSGKPISVSGNIALHLDGMITGAAGQPAISVDGNVRIYANRYGHSADDKLFAQVYGGAGAPAVKATGDIWVDGLNSYTQTLVFKGDNGRPAFEAQRVCFFEPLLAGESETAADFIGTYQAQSYVCAEYPITIEAKEGDVLPAFPDTAFRKFVGWQTERTMTGCPDIQYRPGDTYTGEQRMLVAYYMPSACGAVVLDGNGGVTTKDSKYYVIESSGADLRVTADTLTDAFQRDGYRIDAYSTDDAGKQNRTAAEDLAERLTEDTTIAGQIWTYFAQWERIGDKTEDNSAYYTKADDGTVKIESVDQAVLEEQLKKSGTVQIDLSKLKDAPRDVILPVSAVNNVLDLKVEALSIKMADAVVTLDKTAMQSVIEMANGADIQLHVSTDDALSGNQAAIIGSTVQSKALDVSLTANGTEIHNFDGKVTISVPFTWTKQGVLQAWYLADGKKKEAIDVAYRDGNAVLTLSHFSTYAVTVTDAPNDTIVNIGKNSVTVNVPESNCVSCIAALFSADGRQLAVGQATVNQGGETTVTWGAVNSAEVLTLKLFWLDAKGAPTGSVLSVLVKVSAR